jgi:hypothetical protein
MADHICHVCIRQSVGEGASIRVPGVEADLAGSSLKSFVSCCMDCESGTRARRSRSDAEPRVSGRCAMWPGEVAFSTHYHGRQLNGMQVAKGVGGLILEQANAYCAP